MDNDGGGDWEGDSQKTVPVQEPEDEIEQYDEEVQGAVGDVPDGTPDYGQQRRYLTDDEKRIVRQAQFLLNSFIIDSAESDHMSQDNCDLLRQAINSTAGQEEINISEDLKEIALSFRKIGDQVNEKITRDKKINALINNVSPGSQYDIFEKVCSEMFGDGQFNWGRIVVLFYFAYKLISKAVSTTQDCFEWIKRVLKLAIEYFSKYFLYWVLQRGGWKMIIEYWGTSSKTFVALVVASTITGLYYFFK